MPKRLLKGQFGKPLRRKSAVLAAPGRSLDPAVKGRNGVVLLSTRPAGWADRDDAYEAVYPLHTNTQDVTGKTSFSVLAGSPAIATVGGYKALSFTGTASGSISAPLNQAAEDNWEIGFWVYVVPPTSGQYSLIAPQSLQDGIQLEVTPDGTLIYSLWVGGVNVNSLITNDSIANRWTHIRFYVQESQSPGLVFLAVDGVGGWAQASARPNAAPANLVFGPGNSGGSFAIRGLIARIHERPPGIWFGDSTDPTPAKYPQLVPSSDYVLVAPFDVDPFPISIGFIYRTSAAAYITGKNARNGGAMLLEDGETWGVNTPAFDNPAPISFSAGVWVRGGGGFANFSCGPVEFHINGADISFTAYDAGFTATNSAPYTSLSTSVWSHIAIEVLGDFAYCYINGAIVEKLTLPQIDKLSASYTGGASIDTSPGMSLFVSDFYIAKTAKYGGKNFTPPKTLRPSGTMAIARVEATGNRVRVAGGATVQVDATADLSTSVGGSASLASDAATTASATAALTVIPAVLLAATPATTASATAALTIDKPLAAAPATTASATAAAAVGKSLAASAQTIASSAAKLRDYVQLRAFAQVAPNFNIRSPQSADTLIRPSISTSSTVVETSGVDDVGGPYVVWPFIQGTQYSFGGVYIGSPYVAVANETFELWVRPRQFNMFKAGLFGYSDTTNVNSLYYPMAINLLPTGQVEAYYARETASLTPTILTSAASLQLGKWNHIAFVKEGLKRRLYINGVLSASGTAVADPYSPATTGTNIGQEFLYTSGRSKSSYVGDFGYIRGSNYARFNTDFTPETGYQAYTNVYLLSGGAAVNPGVIPALRADAVVGATATATLGSTKALAANAVVAASATANATHAASLSANAVTAVGSRVFGFTGDPYFSNVAVLWPLTDASNTTPVDYSPRPKVVKQADAAGFFVSSVANPFSAYNQNNPSLGNNVLTGKGSNNTTTVNHGFYIDQTDPNWSDFVVGNGDFTMECWFSDNAIIGLNSHPVFGLDTLQVETWANTTFDVWFKSPSGNKFLYGSAPTIRQTVGWIHIAVVRSGATLSLYQNGERTGTLDVGTTFLTTPISFSYGTDPQFLLNGSDGYFSDVRFTKGVARYVGPSFQLDRVAYNPTYQAYPANPIQLKAEAAVEVAALASIGLVLGAPLAANAIVVASATAALSTGVALAANAQTTVSASAQLSGGGSVSLAADATVQASSTAAMALAVPLTNATGEAFYTSVVALLHGDGTNNSTTFADSAQTPKTFTAVSGAKISTAQSRFNGASMLFNGSTDYLTTPDSADFAFGAGDFTVEMWVRPAATVSATQLLCGQWGVTSLSWNIILTATNALALETSITGAYDPTRDLVSAAQTVLPGVWTHVAMTRLGNLYTLWANGVSVGTLTVAGTLTDSTLAMTVGASAVPSQFFNGNIDELRITKGKARYTAAFTPATLPFVDTPLTGPGAAVSASATLGYNIQLSNSTGDPHYNNVSLLLHMDGTNGSTTFADTSPSPKTVTAVGNAQISTAQSKLGGASGLFDGTGDYLTIPNSAAFDFGAGDFTIETYVRLGSITGGHHIISKYQTSAFGPFAIFQNAAEIGFYASSNGTSWNLLSDLTFGTGLTVGVWYHLAVTRNGNVWRTFMNGNLISSATVAGTLVSNTELVQIGRGTNGSPTEFNGNIDDLRVTKGVARYASNFTLPTTAYPDANQSGPGATASASAALTVGSGTAQNLAATPAVQVDATANLSNSIALASAPVVTAIGSAELDLNVTLASASTTTASASANLLQTVQMAAAPATTVSATAALTVGKALAAASATEVSASAALGLNVRLAATPATSVSATAGLIVTRDIASAADTTASASASLSVGKPLAADAQTIAVVGSVLAIGKAVASSAIVVANSTASLIATNPVVPEPLRTYVVQPEVRGLVVEREDRLLSVPDPGGSPIVSVGSTVIPVTADGRITPIGADSRTLTVTLDVRASTPAV